MVETKTSHIHAVVSLPAKVLEDCPGDKCVLIARLELVSADSLYPWPTLEFNISISEIVATIVLVFPAAVSSAGGAFVELTVTGLPSPPLNSNSSINVTIGSVLISVVDILAFDKAVGRLLLRVVAPQLEAGISSVAVKLLLAGLDIPIRIGGGALLVYPGRSSGSICHV